MSGRVVLDSSAVLSVLLNEPGRDEVAAVWDRSVLPSANLAEVISRIVRGGRSAADAIGVVKRSDLAVEPVNREDGELAGKLWPIGKNIGLSLGDRLCLASAFRLEATVLTADRAWATLDIGIKIEVIR